MSASSTAPGEALWFPKRWYHGMPVVFSCSTSRSASSISATLNLDAENVFMSAFDAFHGPKKSSSDRSLLWKPTAFWANGTAIDVERLDKLLIC